MKNDKKVEFIERSTGTVPWAALNSFPRKIKVSQYLSYVTMDGGNASESQAQKKWRIELGDILSFVYTKDKKRVLKNNLDDKMLSTNNPIVVFSGINRKTGFLHGINLRLFKSYRKESDMALLLYKLKQNYYKNVQLSDQPLLEKSEDEKPAWNTSNSFRYENFSTAYNMNMKAVPKYYRAYDINHIFNPVIINIEEAEHNIKMSSFIEK
jgi:hypothetical protein